MGRSARQLEQTEPWSVADGAAALLGLIGRNPTLVGGSTAFLVALSFVSANALWYQPHAHSNAFFATRDLLRSDPPVIPDETTILIERPEPEADPAPQVEGDPTVKDVQKTLKDLNFYDGDVDGLYGPNTRLAIEAYQSKIGLPVTGSVDGLLLDQLGTGSVKPPAVPTPAPRDAVVQKVSTAPAQERAVASLPQPAPVRDELVAKVQAGLREFGNEAIQIDGLMGAKTESAIREFQSLFDLPVTGRADKTVYAKMREIGLVK